jgi:hypothetical protein
MAFETKATHIMFLRFIMHVAETTDDKNVLAALRKLYEDVQAVASADGANIPSFDTALNGIKKQG